MKRPARFEVDYRLDQSLEGDGAKRSRDVGRMQAAAICDLAEAIREQTEMADRIEKRQARRAREGRA